MINSAVIHRPGDIDWKAFNEAVDKINKVKGNSPFITLEEARKRRNYDKFIETNLHPECTAPDREGYDCSEDHGAESR